MTDQNADIYATPEAALEETNNNNEECSQELAHRLTRLGAALLDVVLGIAILILPLWLYAAINGEGVLTLLEDGYVGYKVTGLQVILYFIVQGYLLTTRGQTVGKIILFIKIVRNGGDRAGFLHVFGIRTFLVYMINMIPLVGTIFSIIDVLFIFGHQKKCIHDYMADTKVIKVQ